MKNQITNLHIENFKSIKSIDLDCKRINVFVGRPNVGKSNILEALSLYSYGTSFANPISNIIRLESMDNLFYDSNIRTIIKIFSNVAQGFLKYDFTSFSYELLVVKGERRYDFEQNISVQKFIETKLSFGPPHMTPAHSILRFDSNGSMRNRISSVDLQLRKYSFANIKNRDDSNIAFLNSPYGENLVSILETIPKLRKIVSSFFREYGLDLVINIKDKSLEIQKRVDDIVYKTPYSLIADTLQRIIFHLAAIYSNDDTILLFEEPEAHSFPPYISMLADTIVESKNNQFFIATHSPDILNTFLGKVGYEEMAIFTCYYEDYQTKIKQLSEKEFGNLLDTGADVFYNIDAYLPQ